MVLSGFETRERAQRAREASAGALAKRGPRAKTEAEGRSARGPRFAWALARDFVYAFI